MKCHMPVLQALDAIEVETLYKMDWDRNLVGDRLRSLWVVLQRAELIDFHRASFGGIQRLILLSK